MGQRVTALRMFRLSHCCVDLPLSFFSSSFVALYLLFAKLSPICIFSVFYSPGNSIASCWDLFGFSFRLFLFPATFVYAMPPRRTRNSLESSLPVVCSSSPTSTVSSTTVQSIPPCLRQRLPVTPPVKSFATLGMRVATSNHPGDHNLRTY